MGRSGATLLLSSSYKLVMAFFIFSHLEEALQGGVESLRLLYCFSLYILIKATHNTDKVIESSLSGN